MDEFAEDLGMVPYPLIFPATEEGVMGLTLHCKVGKAKAGSYIFVESYCLEPGCDCRRTALLVIDGKGKRVATIEFGFDPNGHFAGPSLNTFEKQAAGAADLLQIFVEAIGENPDWLQGMYTRYKQVRKEVDGRAYRGKPFPKPGTTPRFVPAPAEEAVPFAHFRDVLHTAAASAPSGDRKRTASSGKQGTPGAQAPALAKGMADWVECYRHDEEDFFEVQGGRLAALRNYLLAHPRAGDELAQLLVDWSATVLGEAQLEAALQLLADIFEILRVDLERRRPDAAARMERWQAALAGRIYAAGVDPQIGAMATRVLLDARVEILPLLHQANSRRMDAELAAEPVIAPDPEQPMLDLLRELEVEGVGNPHDLFEALLQMMAVGDAEVQVNLCRLMLEMEHPVVRETAMLMLFHPQGEVRSGVAQVLAEVAGDRFTPAALRRLILVRNWFPEALRAKIDQSIANARRARVECAPLAPRQAVTVYASGIDGARAQTLQAIVPAEKGFLCCSLLPKAGAGLADAFLMPFAGKRDRNAFLAVLRDRLGAVETTPDYFDRRVCQALADGAMHGKVPSHWLVAIAERLGRDQWKAAPLDIAAELAGLRAALGGRFATERYRQQALAAAGDWPRDQPFAYSWFEDDAEVDTVVRKAQGKRPHPDDVRCLAAIVRHVLVPRRPYWLERLVLTAQWLKAATKPPVPWQQMLHVAEALADKTVLLDDIPLMDAIAEESYFAFIGRQQG